MLLTLHKVLIHPRAFRAIAWCMVLAMLVAIADMSAANRDPSHGHLVYGGTALDRARALQRHTHESASPDVCVDERSPLAVKLWLGNDEHDGHAAEPVAVLSDEASDTVIVSVRGPSTSATVLGLDTGVASAISRQDVPLEEAQSPLPESARSHWIAPDLLEPTPPPKAY